MFEKEFADYTASIFIENKDASLLQKYGFQNIKSGWLPLTSTEGLKLYKKLDDMRTNVSNRYLKRWDSIKNTISRAFGPEFEEYI